jgi:hypothetical protein
MGLLFALLILGLVMGKGERNILEAYLDNEIKVNAFLEGIQIKEYNLKTPLCLESIEVGLEGYVSLTNELQKANSAGEISLEITQQIANTAE